jgi:hypothetical protein
VVSSALGRWADLEAQKRSALGRHVKEYLTPSMQGPRFAGNVERDLLYTGRVWPSPRTSHL